MIMAIWMYMCDSASGPFWHPPVLALALGFFIADHHLGAIQIIPYISASVFSDAQTYNVMQRSVLRPAYLKQTLQSASTKHWHECALTSIPRRTHSNGRRPLQPYSPVQARKGLSELLSLSETP